jgi:PAS domain S-box-containing protein
MAECAGHEWDATLNPAARRPAPAPRVRRRGGARTPSRLEGELLQIVSAVAQLPVPSAAHAQTETDQPRYREFLDALGVAVYTTDADGRITFFNEAAATFWGRRPELGEEWCGTWRLYWPDGRPMAHDECPMATCLKENRPVRGGSAIAERPDGTRRAFVPYPTPLRDATGSLVGAVNVLVDVTERVRAEDDLRATAEALRASNAVKDEFLGLVSHELRTPVTTVFGNARLLHDRGQTISADVRQAMVADIAEDSERLLRIVENLLMLARLGAGTTLDLELEPQLLGHVVKKAVEAFSRRHPERVVTLHPWPMHVIVEADRTCLELVIENLLSNADKYSPQTEPIDVDVSADGGEARVVVMDRGIGIGAEESEQIFTPFFRGEAARPHANGLGVGLTVCRRIMEIQGGRAWAGPRTDGGAPRPASRCRWFPKGSSPGAAERGGRPGQGPGRKIAPSFGGGTPSPPVPPDHRISSVPVQTTAGPSRVVSPELARSSARGRARQASTIGSRSHRSVISRSEVATIGPAELPHVCRNGCHSRVAAS